MIKTLNVIKAWDQIKAEKDFMFIDVREKPDYLMAHASGAVNIPLDSIDSAMEDTDRFKSKDQNIFLICRSGKRSMMAAEKFASNGFNSVFSVDGGTEDWISANLPVEK